MPAIRASETPGLDLRIDGLSVAVPQRDGSRLPILTVRTLELPAGAQVAVTGPSGAGKSTLLGVLAGLLKPDRGQVVWGHDDLARLSESARDAWRRRSIGLVFQDFHLVPELDAMANILLPTGFARMGNAAGTRARAASLASAMGLADPHRRAGLLSRGEQQRTAVARALLHDPPIILADEPTASLDESNGRAVAELLVETATRSGATLVVVTHDPGFIARLDHRWPMSGGRMAPAGSA